MSQNLRPLILDFLEWLDKQPRRYADVMDAWRTACPRLTVWEDAIDEGLVERKGDFVIVTDKGRLYALPHPLRLTAASQLDRT